MASAPAAEDKFKANITALTSLIIDIIADCNDRGYEGIDAGVINKASQYISKFDNHELVRNYILYSYEFWPQMKEKNDDFFAKNCGKIFGFLPLAESEITFFTSVFSKLANARDSNGDLFLDEEYKEDLWTAFFALGRVCKSYIQENPRVVDEINLHVRRMNKRDDNNELLLVKSDVINKMW